MVVVIGEANKESEIFLRIGVRHPLSYMSLGRHADHQHDTYASYLIQEEYDNYEVMVPFEWQHMCYSYNNSGYSQMVLVSY